MNSATISWLWSPKDIADPLVRLAFRCWLVMASIAVVSITLVGIDIVAALVGHPLFRSRFILGLMALAVAQAPIRHSIRPLIMVRQGWLTRRGETISRSGQPRRYWSWLAWTAVTPLVEFAAVGFVMWMTLVRF